MNIQPFFDPNTFTLTYVVYDLQTRDAIVIDPVLDYVPVGSKVATDSYQQVKSFLMNNDLNLHWVLETHAHADHMSASQLFKQDFPGVRLGIGKQIVDVQRVFKTVYNLNEDFVADGSQFDLLINDNQVIEAGSLLIRALHTPGHTPACHSFLIDDAVFTGDALFMPDYGTGRCDFPKGDAEELYNSITERLYLLPEQTRVFVGHDYQPNGRPMEYESTIRDEKQQNVQLSAKTNREEFVSFREQRDANLAAPKLIYQSLQVNIEAGKLPVEEANGRQYLKIPINL